MKKLITGNEAVAWGALAAGVKVVTGYPGTPSTGALASLLTMDLPDRHVEWSVNEKVAIDVAAGVAWGGHRVLCTMKMSGVNVAYDSLIGIAYSGNDGGMVVYVADDPGTSAGMCEQDSRGFAYMTDMVCLEPSTVAEAYSLTKFAFDLSEKIKAPVFVRLVSALANSFSEVDVDEPAPVSKADVVLERDINRYTKAGAVICMNQHRWLIERLAQAGELIEAQGVNKLQLSQKAGGVGIIASGVVVSYLEEAFDTLAAHGLKREEISVLEVRATNPLPVKEINRMLSHCNRIVVLEELEPYLEKEVYVAAQKMDYKGEIIGKLDGTLSRIGEYGLPQLVIALNKTINLNLPEEMHKWESDPEKLAAARPITVCAGCPHRGTYMAINQAIRKLKLKQDEVMVTGDIGCTILGMNPPFNTIWNEISMGSSISMAQGYVYAGIKTPVIATIGDSTFFHGGIPGLINAVQHQVNVTLIIMDNRWTAMTGMQINPGTPEKHQPEARHVDIEKIVPALGVDQFFVIDPFNLKHSAETIQKAMTLPGVKVILARGECAIQAKRHGEDEGKFVRVVTENCNLCKLCIMVTGCSALSIGKDAVIVDPVLCRVCGMCVQTCNRSALVIE